MSNVPSVNEQSANMPPTAHRIQQFNNWHKGGELTLQPPYQRNPIWSLKNKSYLIDSILENFPVPEIFMQVKTTHNGCVKYSVVDGQQRIRTILEFIDGSFKILESESKTHGGKFFKDLDSDTKRNFWSYRIVTREINESDEDVVKMIFKRMNKYVIPLKPQEIRNATYRGKFIELAKHLVKMDYWADNKIVSPEDIRRMTDIEFISELIISVLNNNAETKNAEAIDKYYTLYDDTFHEADEIKRKFNATVKLLGDIMQDLRPTRWNRKPEFYALFLAFIQLLNEYVVPSKEYSNISKKLLDFSKYVQEIGGNRNINVDLFIETLSAHTTNKEQRNSRVTIVKELILPFLIVKDNERNFTDAQRRLKWDQTDDKLCAICRKIVEWDDYNIDHVKPHNKGGETILSNAQITHSKCNQKKSDNYVN